MRDRLISMPTWALFLVTGVAWVALLFAIDLIYGDSLLRALVPAAILGAVLGAGTTIALKFGGRTEKRALGNVSNDVRREASRAAQTGPVPADPEVRAAALRLAEQRLHQVRRVRPVLAVFAVLAVTGTAVSAFDSPWHLLYLALYIPMLATWLLVPKRLRARIALLSEEPQEPVLRTQ